MVSVKEVEKLNEKIEAINLERTKAKARQEVLQKKLDEELLEYKEKFGVDLSGADLKSIKAKIDAEVKKVTAVVEEEYNLKVQVVKAIENGDYEEANRLMGIEEVEEDVEEPMVEETVEESTSEVEEAEEEAEEGSETLENLDEDDEDDDFGFNDFSLDDSEEIASTEEDVEETEEVEESEEDEDDEIVIPNAGAQSFLNAVQNQEKPKGTMSVDEAFSGLDASMLEVEDEEEEDDDFGFGDVLAGSKFE